MRRIVGASALLATLSLTAPVEANCTLIAGNVARTPDANLVDNGDDTVTDNTTGLRWKKCVEGLSGAGCTGTATPLTWSEALQRGSSDTTGNFSDWRLPTKNQLMSLVETACRAPAINTTRFPNTQPNYYWSATPDPNFGSSAWYVDFSGDNATRMGIDNKTVTHLVRLVRSTIADDNYDLATPAPNTFTLTGVTGATVSTVYTSNTITVAGLTVSPANIKISGGTYQKNALAYTAANGTVVNGDTIKVQQTSSADSNTQTRATLTIGGVSRNFSVTTAP
jgi:hypothetical protein